MDSTWFVTAASAEPVATIRQPVSYSAFAVFRECGLRLRYSRASQSAFPTIESPAGAIGTALHETLAQIGTLSAESGGDLAQYSRRLVDAFRERCELARQRLTQYPRSQSLPWPVGRVEQIENALIRVARNTLDSGTVHRARSLSAQASTEAEILSRDGVVLGKIDRAESVRGAVTLIDYKSALDATEETRRSAEEQLQLYCYLWHDSTGTWPQRGIANFVAANVIADVNVEPSACNETAEAVRSFAARLGSLNGARADEIARPGAACRFCPYKPWCRPFWNTQETVGTLPSIAMGLQGKLTQKLENGNVTLMQVRNSVRSADVRFRNEMFPQLVPQRPGVTLRFIGAEVQGSVERPSLTLNERSEAFIVDSDMQSDVDRLVGDKQLASVIGKLSKVAASARSLAIAVRSRDIISIDRTLSGLAKETSSLTECIAYLESQELREVESAISAAASEFRVTYASTLIALLRQAGLALSGEWPVLIINDVVRLQVDVRAGSAAINSRRLNDLRPQAVADAIARVLRELDAGADSAEFLGTFVDSYYAVIGMRNLADGDYVDLRAVCERVRSTYGRGSRYDHYRFGVDLYSALKAWSRSDISLDLSPAQNASRGLFVPGPHGGNFIGAVRILRNA